MFKWLKRRSANKPKRFELVSECIPVNVGVVNIKCTFIGGTSIEFPVFGIYNENTVEYYRCDPVYVWDNATIFSAKSVWDDYRYRDSIVVQNNILIKLSNILTAEIISEGDHIVNGYKRSLKEIT
jgi:hypothetical protein